MKYEEPCMQIIIIDIGKDVITASVDEGETDSGPW